MARSHPTTASPWGLRRTLQRLVLLVLAGVGLPVEAQPAPSQFDRLRLDFERRGYSVLDDHPRCRSEPSFAAMDKAFRRLP